ncbi:MAG: hypothetical protein IT314_05945 [Anaerolineales bacterium]|nr:hypothetical protein [Anaerolineales bacterium]
MKKFFTVALLAVFLSGCSGLTPLIDLIASPTPIPPDTLTPRPTVTLIPTRDLFATLTPTLLTHTPTTTPLVPEQGDTDTPTPLPTFAPPSTSQGSSILTPKGGGFLTILTSHYVIYYNTGSCSPRTVKVTAFVQDIIHTDHVLIFMRPREKSDTMLLGDWSSGEMLQNDNGSYSYDVSAVNIRKYYWFRDAWIEYQLIAYDEDGVELARSQIFDRNLSLVMCRSFSP